MSAMENTPEPLARSDLDLLSGILERLNGTIARVSKLRQSIGDLEIELIEICHQYETACAAATNEDRSHDIQNVHARDGPHQDLIWLGRKKDQRKREDKRTEILRSEHKHNPKSNPITMIAHLFKKSEPTSRSPSPRLSSSSRIPGHEAGNSHGVSHAQSRVTLVQARLQEFAAPGSTRKHTTKHSIPKQIPLQHLPQPPTHPYPFPHDIDLASYPPELKCEGNGWFVLFNPSPKVKRVLNVNLVHTLIHDSDVECATFSRDGNWLATGCQRTAQIYSVKTGIQVCILDHENDKYVNSISFSPNGKYLATAGADHHIRVWDIANQKIHTVFNGHQRTIYSLCFLPNGQFIISGSSDGTVRIWDVNVHDRAFQVLTINGHYLSPDHRVRSVATSPDGRYVAVASLDTVVTIWEITTGALVQTLRGHKNYVYSVAFTPDGRGLISGSRDATLKYWDVSGLGIMSDANTALKSVSSSSSPCLMNLTGHKGSLYSTSVSHDGTWVASGSADGNVLIWDTRTGVVQCMLLGHNNYIWDVDMSPMGGFLATASHDKQVRIWSYGMLE